MGTATWLLIIGGAIWYINHELDQLAKRRAEKRKNDEAR
jgi:hypothetical protein